MPNWFPEKEHRERFVRAVGIVMQNRVNMMEEGFPLNLTDVTLITRPPELINLMNSARYGEVTVSTTSHISFEMSINNRWVIVSVQLPDREYIAYFYEQQVRKHYRKDTRLYFNPNALPEDKLHRLHEWVKTALYERRLAKMTALTINDFFNHIEDISIYHIAKRWPALKVMFPRAVIGYEKVGGLGRHREIWERKGKQLGRNLNRWDWPLRGPEDEWFSANRRKMQLCEEALLSAVTLEQHEVPDNILTANVSDWEVFEGQPL